MIVYCGTTHDTSDDGSKQPHAASIGRPAAAAGSDQADMSRLDDDGASLGSAAAVALPAPAVAVAALADAIASTDWVGAKPAWSVLSLKDLNAAIRRSAAARPREQAEQVERARLAVELGRERHAAAAVRAERDRYRNAWETT